MIILVIDAVTGLPIPGARCDYLSNDLLVQGSDLTDSEGKMNAGIYPIYSLFNVTCEKEGYDTRTDVEEVRDDDELNVIPLNPKVSFWLFFKH